MQSTESMVAITNMKAVKKTIKYFGIKKINSELSKFTPKSIVNLNVLTDIVSQKSYQNKFLKLNNFMF